MKRQIVLMTSALCLGIIFAGNSQPEKLRGKVKSVKEQTTNRHKKSFVGDDRSITFNSRGDTTEVKFYRADGSAGSRVTYTYDERGKLSEKIEYLLDGMIASKAVYFYNERGVLTGIDRYGFRIDYRDLYETKEDGKFVKTHNTYEVKVSFDTQWNVNLRHLTYSEISTVGKKPDMNEPEKYFYSDDPKDCYKDTCRYDRYKKQIELTRYRLMVVCRDRYVTDGKGNRIKATRDTVDNVSTIIAYKCDTQGNRTEESYSYTDGNLERKGVRYTYVYDENQRMIQRNFYNELGRWKYKYSYLYDEKGNMTEEKHYDLVSTIEYTCNYTYTFDYQGNWTKRKNSKGELTERKIEYYN